MHQLTETQKAYIAGFIDGDGSIYVRAKSRSEYRFGFQISPYIVLFQSNKEKENFLNICELIDGGSLRERKDGVLEYTVNRKDAILQLVEYIKPYTILKKHQIILLEKIFEKKDQVNSKKDFQELLDLVYEFRNLNYSTNRKKHKLTP